MRTSKQQFIVFATMIASFAVLYSDNAHAIMSADDINKALDECKSDKKIDEVKDLQEQLDKCKIVSNNADDSGLDDENKENAKKDADKKIEEIEKELPAVVIGDSGNWSLTIPVFAGLAKVNFGDSKGDNFSFLNGLGSGAKVRYSGLFKDGSVNEIVGLSLGFYLERISKGDDKTEFALAPVFMFSTFEILNLGVGYTLFNSEDKFDRSSGHNIFVIFGVGADGNTFLSQ